jgi:hypothetical protein
MSYSPLWALCFYIIVIGIAINVYKKAAPEIVVYAESLRINEIQHTFIFNKSKENYGLLTLLNINIVDFGKWFSESTFRHGINRGIRPIILVAAARARVVPVLLKSYGGVGGMDGAINRQSKFISLTIAAARPALKKLKSTRGLGSFSPFGRRRSTLRMWKNGRSRPSIAFKACVAASADRLDSENSVLHVARLFSSKIAEVVSRGSQNNSRNEKESGKNDEEARVYDVNKFVVPLNDGDNSAEESSPAVAFVYYLLWLCTPFVALLLSLSGHGWFGGLLMSGWMLASLILLSGFLL